MASGYQWELKSGLQRKLGHALTMLLPQFLNLKNLRNSSSVTNKNQSKLCLLRPEEKSHNCAAIVWTPFKAEDNIKGKRVKFSFDSYPLQPLLGPKLQHWPQLHLLLGRVGAHTSLTPRVPAERANTLHKNFPLGRGTGSPCVSSASSLEDSIISMPHNTS